MQMTEENLKLKEMTIQLNNFDFVSSEKQETLKMRHKNSIAELESQRKRFMDQLQQVIWKELSNLLIRRTTEVVLTCKPVSINL